MGENEKKEEAKIVKRVTVIAIDSKLDDKIIAMCEKHGIDRDTFINNALNNYVKYLGKKKVN